MDEDAWVARILARTEGGGALRIPPGHDCAAVDVEGGIAVLTTDVLVDGVHFQLDACGARAAARKALLVNLSDLAAAGARPVAFEVGVVLPRDRDPRVLDELAHGFGEVARRYRCPLAGGDTNVADGPLVLAVTAVGQPGPGGLVTRRGARVGDRLSVTGPLGGSLSGRHLDFVPRLAEGLLLAERRVAHAMMDLSDGLSRDLPRLCRASGVGARIDAARVPVHPDAAGPDGLEHALDDGEDFELLVAHAPLAEAERRDLAARGVALIEIGEVVEADAGVVLVRGETSAPLEPRGFDHFVPGARAGAAASDAWVREAQGAEDTRALGAALGAVARPQVASEALVVALDGDLGAGKTVFVQGVGRGFGIPPAQPIVSPTFQVARAYAEPGPAAQTLYHVDAYRLRDADELEHAGFEDMCGKGSLTCVEWASRVAEGLPSDRIEIRITAPTAERRRLEIRARGPRSRAVLAAWRRRVEAAS